MRGSEIEREVARGCKAANEYRPGVPGFSSCDLSYRRPTSAIARECTNAICSGGLIGRLSGAIAGPHLRGFHLRGAFLAEINSRGNTRDPSRARKERITFARNIEPAGGEPVEWRGTRRAARFPSRDF